MLVIILHAEILAMCVCLARFAKHIPVIRLTYASRCIQMTAHTKKKKNKTKQGRFWASPPPLAPILATCWIGSISLPPGRCCPCEWSEKNRQRVGKPVDSLAIQVSQCTSESPARCSLCTRALVTLSSILTSLFAVQLLTGATTKSAKSRPP